MTVEKLYEKIDGSYESVLRRIPTDKLIVCFAKKFLIDESYDELTKAVKDGDVIASFEASHKLKGIVANLGFTSLFEAVNQLTEHLRAKPQTVDLTLVDNVSQRYDVVVKGIRDFEYENK